MTQTIEASTIGLRGDRWPVRIWYKGHTWTRSRVNTDRENEVTSVTYIREEKGDVLTLEVFND